MSTNDQVCATNIVAVAVDAGPIQVMKALTFPNMRLVRETTSIDGCDLLIVGTSGSEAGQLIEMQMRRKAVLSSTPLIVIEDFPGNYRHVDGGEPDLLLVEHECVAALHRRRLGSCPEIVVLPNPRYDPFRREGVSVAALLQKQWKASTGRPSILWAGQPETEDALRTLEYLFPDISDLHLTVLMKAHPRDGGYREGVYASFFESHQIPYIDVTNISLRNCCLEYAPRLIITQFSSLAIEAGFMSLPSIYVLYQEIGAKRLFADKGYSVPPWCDYGAALLIDRPEGQREALELALFDEGARSNMISSFEHFWGGQCSAKDVNACIMRLADKNVFSCGH